MVRSVIITDRATDNIPHTRGDGPTTISPQPFEVKYSPHAWGWSDMLIPPCSSRVIFPTRVGMVRLLAFHRLL